MLFIVSIAAVVAMTSVLLVFQMGQPRIWMTMSRDGLMPKRFSTIHPKYKTPSFATLITGLVVGIPIFFTDENFVLDFTSIGTLFAFVLVCGGVLMLSPQSETEIAERETKGKFRIPYVNSKFIFPVLVLIATILILNYVPDFFTNLFDFSIDKLATNIPMLVFILVCIVMTILSFTKNLSLIPLLGLISCSYLLTGMAVSNWMWFGVWLVIGLVIYFAFSYKNSKLNDSI
jgi:amino acid transporter